MCADHNNWHYYCQVYNMAEFMVQADLAIGAGGTTTWERCFLQLPAIVIAVAENQIISCEVLSKNNIIKFLGLSNMVDSQSITKAIEEFNNWSLEIAQGIKKILGDNHDCEFTLSL